MSPAHRAALEAANPAKDGDILKILKDAKSVDATDKSSGDSSTKNEDEVPFYRTNWFMTISVVVLIAAIGGGAYIMTHKTDETDL